MSRKGIAAVCVATGMVGAVLGLLVSRALASGIPAAGALTYSGYLEDATGKAQTAQVQLEVKLWPAPSGGTTSLCPMAAAVPITPQNGRFSVVLPDTCVAAVKANTNVYAEVIVNGSALGRAKIGAVPYAVEADHAVSADTATNATNATSAANASAAAGALKTNIDNLNKALTTGCTGASALQGMDALGNPKCTPTNDIVAITANYGSGAGTVGGTATATCPANYKLLAAGLMRDWRTNAGSGGWDNGGIIECTTAGNTVTTHLDNYGGGLGAPDPNGSNQTNVMCFGLCVPM